jgi:hypothetical protein
MELNCLFIDARTVAVNHFKQPHSLPISMLVYTYMHNIFVLARNICYGASCGSGVTWCPFYKIQKAFNVETVGL